MNISLRDVVLVANHSSILFRNAHSARISRRSGVRSQHGAREQQWSCDACVMCDEVDRLSLSPIGLPCHTPYGIALGAGSEDHSSKSKARALKRSRMSISAALQASAKAAYRDFLRATSVTFVGDPAVRNGQLQLSTRWCLVY